MILYAVEKRERKYDSSYWCRSPGREWYSVSAGKVADSDLTEALDMLHRNDILPPGDWELRYYEDTWSIVSLCFTEKAAIDVVDSADDLRVTTYSAADSPEWVLLQQILHRSTDFDKCLENVLVPSAVSHLMEPARSGLIEAAALLVAAIRRKESK